MVETVKVSKIYLETSRNDYLKLWRENKDLLHKYEKQKYINEKLTKHIKLALDFLASPDEVNEDANNVQLAFDELNQALKESEENNDR